MNSPKKYAIMAMYKTYLRFSLFERSYFLEKNHLHIARCYDGMLCICILR